MTWREEAGLPPMFTGWDCTEGRLARARNRLGYAAWRWYMRPLVKVINRYRRTWNLPRVGRIDETLSPLAHVAQSCPEFDFPRRELPDTFHYVGSLTARRERGGDHGFPWQRLDGRPLIFASLGTVNDPTNLPVFPKIAEACAGLDAQLVMTLGRWHDKHVAAREKLGSLPGDPLLVDFAPQLEIMERAALLITHAGMNTTLESICSGVPMVAMPRSGDQPAVAARIEHAGVGLRGSFHGGTAGELRRIVQRVLSEERFRLRARELQQAMIAAGGASRAADIVEEVLSTRRPVKRTSSASLPRPATEEPTGDIGFLPREGS
jgi:MGT family glycosyltransferase